MESPLARSRLSRCVQLLVVCLVLAGCRGPQSMLESAGPEAAAVIRLWWVLFAVAMIVLLTVIGFLLASCFRAGREPSGESGGGLGGTLTIGGLATVFLLLALLVITYEQSQTFADEQDGEITIEVSGKLWWWTVSYFNHDGEKLFETANEIHIPAGVPVRLRLVSDNVIHSFWVPKLGGKVDLVPGRTNYLWIQADEPGTYRGQCAELCGVQHAKMAFFVVATPPEEFVEWMARQQRPASDPASDLARRGKEVFRTAGCAQCHTIRGAPPAPPGASPIVRVVAPDLTHLASRESLAAGTLPNRRGHLGGWIADPQSVKPGSLMPAFPLPADDFHALLHYLETLE